MAGGRAEAIQLTGMLGADRIRLDRHSTDRIAVILARVGNVEVQPCPLPWFGAHIECAADQLGTFAHPTQSPVAIRCIRFGRRREAHAVVGDGYMQAVMLLGEGEIRPACSGMVANVAPGFLHDPEQRQLALWS